MRKELKCSLLSEHGQTAKAKYPIHNNGKVSMFCSDLNLTGWRLNGLVVIAH